MRKKPYPNTLIRAWNIKVARNRQTQSVSSWVGLLVLPSISFGSSIGQSGAQTDMVRGEWMIIIGLETLHHD